ncbi:hypothetical protein L195_g036340 [Trifolium pratense]|uniref:Uncharacterized protein n=1 Tax=Trifolium pratense TaxID=57577 RepID=A0A2K3LP69_TRIPR|nr:hypothetical protein L195_g036340 [Trifolium pratense]
MMTSHPNGHFPANLPILTAKNYDNWCKQMKVVFCYKDLRSVVTEGVAPLGAHASEEEKTSHKEVKKRDFKALFIIHQCVDAGTLKRLVIVKIRSKHGIY